MSSTLLTPEPEPTRPPSPPLPLRIIKTLGLLLLMAAVSAVSAYAVFQWRIQSEQASAASSLATLREQTTRDVSDLREQLKQQQADLTAKMGKVEEAATAAGVLMQKDGAVTGLQARLAEIDTLKLELSKTQADLETKLKAMEQSVRDQVARSEKQTAQALSQEMQYKNLLIKAQGEVLLAQMQWVEGNRGLAKDELSIAARTLQQAMTAAPEPVKPAIKKVVDSAEQTRTALILESSVSRDSLNLLWHQVSELLQPQP